MDERLVKRNERKKEKIKFEKRVMKEKKERRVREKRSEMKMEGSL